MGAKQKYMKRRKQGQQEEMLKEAQSCTFYPKINDFATVRSFDQFYDDMRKFQNQKYHNIQQKQYEKLV